MEGERGELNRNSSNWAGLSGWDGVDEVDGKQCRQELDCG